MKISMHSAYSKQGQPLVYEDVFQACNAQRNVQIDDAIGRRFRETAIASDPTVAGFVCCSLADKQFRAIALIAG